MKVRADVVELLHAGYSDRAIGRHLNTDPKGVAAARALLGLPKAKSGYKAAASPEDLFWRRVRPVGEHMEWDGNRNNRTTPTLRHGGHQYTAYRIAFRIAHGREPVGQALPSCGHTQCVRPGHHADKPMRDAARRADRLYARIFGAAP